MMTAGRSSCRSLKTRRATIRAPATCSRRCPKPITSSPIRVTTAPRSVKSSSPGVSSPASRLLKAGRNRTSTTKLSIVETQGREPIRQTQGLEPGDEVGEPTLFSIACFRLKPIDGIDDVVEAPTQCIRGTHGRSHAETSCLGCNFQGDRSLADGSTEVFQKVHLFNRVVVVGSESNPKISRELGKAVDDIDRAGGTQWPTLANGRIQARKPPLDDIDWKTETHLAL